MGILDFVLLGVGLAMDAFAVSICKGLSMTKINKKQLVIIALFFGGFQALMPLLGFLLGNTFAQYVTKVAHWIGFALLIAIGVKMIIDAVKERNVKLDDEKDLPINYKELFLLAIATSIDAFAVGVTFAFYENVNVWLAIAIIGGVTAIIAGIGVVIGNVFGSRYKFPASVVGGVILILLGIKILLEGLGVIDLSFI